MKIDRLTAQERRVVRKALRALIPACSRRVEAPLVQDQGACGHVKRFVNQAQLGHRAGVLRVELQGLLQSALRPRQVA